MSKEGSFIRWQAISITQMGVAVSLILTLATASLGFALTLSKDQSILGHCWGRSFLVMAGLSLLASIGLGIWCVLNRLEDFRITARIARRREEMEEQEDEKSIIDQKLQCERCESSKRGEQSKTLLNWQARMFVVGIIFLTSAFLCVYQNNLF